MCEECRRFICPSSCPNAYDDISVGIIGYCACCTLPIYTGEGFTENGCGDLYCPACTDDLFGVEEYLDDDEDDDNEED